MSQETEPETEPDAMFKQLVLFLVEPVIKQVVRLSQFSDEETTTNGW